MGQAIDFGVGTSGSKANKSSAISGNPGGGTQATPKSNDPSAYGWKMLDYKFGDRPLYQLMKNKATTGSWCGKNADQKGIGGMINPNAASAASTAAALNEIGPGGTVNPEDEVFSSSQQGNDAANLGEFESFA